MARESKGEFALIMENEEVPLVEETPSPTKAERKATTKAERKASKQVCRLGDLPGWHALKED